MKKILLAGLLIIATMGIARAETPLFDFGSFFKQARAGYSINQHLARSGVVYASFQRFHTAANFEYANVNIGYDTTDRHPVFMLGLRFDNLAPLIWGSDWGKAHVTTAQLPAIELGPYFSTWPYVDKSHVTFESYFGIIFAVGFPQ